MAGLVLGPGLTAWALFTHLHGQSFWERSGIVQLAVFIVSGLGWIGLFTSLVPSRIVIIDLAKKMLTFQTRGLRNWEQSISLDEIERFESIALEVPRESAARRPYALTGTRNLFNAVLKDGSTLQILSSPWDTPWRTMGEFVRESGAVPIRFAAGKVES